MSEPVRRLELFTGAGRRRTWSAEEKADIVAESERPGVSVRAVARRHGLSVSQLFTWRRLARQIAPSDRQAELRFIPAVLEPETAAVEGRGRPRRRLTWPGIEIEVAGATVRVGAGADPAQVEAVIRALKASP